MSKLPSMPFFVDDYVKDTQHLTLEEHGAYLLLLMAMWRHKGAIPDDDKDNARMLRLQPRLWLRLKPRLMPFFETYGGQITQKNLQRKWNWAVENSARQSVKGKAGAKARIERNQLLKSIPGLAPDTAPAYAGVQAQVKHLKKERYITTTFLTAEEASRKDGEFPDGLEFPERGAGHLMQTKLMRKMA